MREDAIFRIASQSKAPVSVAVMMLQEEGKLLIGDPVGRYLPEFARTTVAVPRAAGGYDVVPAKRAITIRDLLTHTAGISFARGRGSAWASTSWRTWALGAYLGRWGNTDGAALTTLRIGLTQPSSWWSCT
jgi:CubicO group peptidase (beta-lactamase class C family)